MPVNNDKPWDARFAYILIYPLRDSRISPDHLTCLRLLVGIMASIAFAQGGFSWTNIGAACFIVSNFLDHADGELARLTGKMSKHGHYFDLASDAIVNIILFVGIGVGLTQSSLGLWALPMGMIAGISVAGIFHMRNQLEHAVGKHEAIQPHYAGFEAEDILYLLPIVCILELLVPFLLLSCIGAPAFAIWVWFDYRSLKKKNNI